jgi:hypothetical protein
MKTPDHIQIPKDYGDFVSSAVRLNIPDLIFRSIPLESVAEYVHSERIPQNFPRPQDHFVIADYLIDLPVITVDLSTASSTCGRILGYTYGDYWIIGNSLAEFLNRLQTEKESAVWGK